MSPIIEFRYLGPTLIRRCHLGPLNCSWHQHWSKHTLASSMHEHSMLMWTQHMDPHVRVALLSLKPPPSPLCVAMTFSALDLMMVPSIATKVHKDEGVREGMEERKQ